MAEILEPNKAKTFLNDHFGNRASQITPLSGGDWSQAYALSLDDKPMVARFGIHAEDYKKDQIMSRWSSSELPIPKVIDLGETEHGFFAVSERAEGDFLDTLNVQQVGAALPGLLRVVDAIRDIDISATNGYGIWRSDGHGPQDTWKEALLYKFGRDQPGSRTYGWRAALEGSPKGAGDFDAALGVLRRLAERMPVRTSGDDGHTIAPK